MSDEIYTEDEVEAHGPLAEGPTAEGPFAEGPTAEATDDEPDFEAHGRARRTTPPARDSGHLASTVAEGSSGGRVFKLGSDTDFEVRGV